MGAKNSFMKMLEVADSKYYMFCDHDDVWLPHKVEVTLKEMKLQEQKHGNIPILVHTDLIVVDEDLNVLDQSFWNYSKIKLKYLSKFKYLVVYNCVTGCAMMINEAAKQISLPIHIDAPMHDWWIARQLSLNGLIISVNEQTILYRQHNNNCFGAHRINLYHYLKRFLKITSIFKIQYNTFSSRKNVGHKSFIKYLWYKLSYSLIRNV
jgi:hypothetical protein